MQNVNDDMDSLFRKAGVDYPLYTGSADWSRVASALETKEEPPAPRKNYGKYLGLILVLLLPWLLTQYDISKLKTAGSSQNTSSFTVDTNPPAESKEIIESSSVSHAEQHLNTEKDLPSATFHGSSSHQAITENVVKHTGNKPDNFTIAFREKSLIKTQDNIAIATKENSKKELPGNAVNETAKKEKTASSINVSPSESSAPPLNTTAASPLHQQSINKQDSIITRAVNTATVQAAEVHDKPLINETATEMSKPSKQVISTAPRKRFYIGVVGGINATSIKMQDVKEMGSDYGFIVGYNFMKNWSVEAGVISSSKYYYSDGKYLDNPKIYMPPNSRINTVEGDCRMIEIPMLLKYDFGFKKRHNWFATGGVSSFLMKKEDYAYDYYYPATGTSYLYKKTYENESENWAAVMQLSAGYNRAILWGIDLRLEPFVQIPLKGAGYGRLPLTSAGLRLGITKKLF